MKSIIKLFLFLAVVAGVIVFGWKLLDSTLFSSDEPTTEIVQKNDIPIENTSPTTPVPAQMSSADVYSSTGGDDSNPAPSPDINCQALDKIVSSLYDMRVSGKSLDQVNDYITNDDNMPAEQVDSFLAFAKALWETPTNKLIPRQQFVAQFMNQCRSIEQESQPSH